MMNELYDEMFEKIDYITFKINVLKVFSEVRNKEQLFDKKA